MTIKELENMNPCGKKGWKKSRVVNFLIWHSNISFQRWIEKYFSKYSEDKKLAKILFEIVLDDDFDGSDAKMGAAYFISKLSEEILKENRELLLQAQKNEVLANRPLSYMDKTLTWL